MFLPLFWKKLLSYFIKQNHTDFCVRNLGYQWYFSTPSNPPPHIHTVALPTFCANIHWLPRDRPECVNKLFYLLIFYWSLCWLNKSNLNNSHCVYDAKRRKIRATLKLNGNAHHKLNLRGRWSITSRSRCHSVRPRSSAKRELYVCFHVFYLYDIMIPYVLFYISSCQLNFIKKYFSAGNPIRVPTILTSSDKNLIK